MFCHCVIVIFFFCKQKTAYDMRISDWSSDVCSSDLLHAEARCGLAVILRIEAVDFGAEFHPSHVAQAHDGPAFGGAQADVAELLRRLQARLDRDGCVELLFLGRRQTTDLNGCNRTAEHTSELKSLMSTSYADFSVKKKNTRP